MKAFPVPIIHKAQVHVSAVESHSASGVFDQQIQVLTSSSGMSYELGRLIKRAIFGAVIHATALKPLSSDKKTFQRTNTSLAIKVFSKKSVRDYSTRSQENPCNELAA